MQNAQLFEKLYAEVYHVFNVLFVAVVPLYEGGERIGKHVGYGLFNRGGKRLVEHYALAQARAGDGKVFYVHIAYERLDYRKRRGKNICTLCRKSLYLLLFVEVENLYHIVQRDKVFCKHIIVVHGIERVLVHHLVDFEQVSERAADAYHLRIGVYVREPLYCL